MWGYLIVTKVAQLISYSKLSLGLFFQVLYIYTDLNDTSGGLASTLHAMCAVSILATPYTLTPFGWQTGGTVKE